MFKDRTFEFNEIMRSIASKNLNSNVTPTLNPAPSLFLAHAHDICKGISGCYAKLEGLGTLCRQSSLFDDHATEIDELTRSVKHDVIILKTKIDELSRTMSSERRSESAQNKKHRKSILTVLEKKLAHVSKNFKNLLELRSKNSKLQKSRQNEFSKNFFVPTLVSTDVLNENRAKSLNTHAQSFPATFNEFSAKNYGDYTPSNPDNTVNTFNPSTNHPPNLINRFNPSKNHNSGSGVGLNNRLINHQNNFPPDFDKTSQNNFQNNDIYDNNYDKNLNNQYDRNISKSDPHIQDQLIILEESVPTYMQERLNAVQTIESTIVELGDIFQQLAHLVNEQEEHIQRIDHNIEMTHLQIESAHSELQKYFNSISSNRWLMIKIFGIFFIFIIIYILLT